MGTVLNALVGAIVSVVLAFLPFSTVLGGAAAGFLEGPDGRSGTIAGALAGLISLLPLAAFGLFVLGVLGFGLGVFGLPFGGFAAIVFLFGLFAAAMVVYTVGFSALGGFLGALLAREFPAQRADVRETMGVRSESDAGYGAGAEYGTDAARGRRGTRDGDRDRDPTRDVDSRLESDSRTDRRDREFEK